MKKTIILLSLAATISLAGCASKNTAEQAPAVAEPAPAQHHDYKGEVK